MKLSKKGEDGELEESDTPVVDEEAVVEQIELVGLCCESRLVEVIAKDDEKTRSTQKRTEASGSSSAAHSIARVLHHLKNLI